MGAKSDNMENNKLEKTDYPTMPLNTEQVVNSAIDFAKKHGNTYARLVSIRKKGMTWYVRLDIGVFNKDYRTVKIDAKGRIIGFTRT